MGISAIACGWAAVLMSSVTGTGVTRALVSVCACWGDSWVPYLQSDLGEATVPVRIFNFSCALTQQGVIIYQRRLATVFAGRSCTTAVGHKGGCSTPCWELPAMSLQRQLFPWYVNEHWEIRQTNIFNFFMASFKHMLATVTDRNLKDFLNISKQGAWRIEETGVSADALTINPWLSTEQHVTLIHLEHFILCGMLLSSLLL